MRKIYLLAFLLQFLMFFRAGAQMSWFSKMALDGNKSYSILSNFQNAISFKDTTIHAMEGYYYPWPIQFLAKCDSDMNLLWYKTMGSPWYYDEQRDVELAADSYGNTYMALALSSSLRIDDTVVVSVWCGADSARLILVKYDRRGKVAWYKKSSVVPLTKSEIGLGVDSSGNVYVSHDFSPLCTFGGDTLRETLTPYGTYIAKFDTAGNEEWLTGLSGYKRNYDFCVSRNGSTYLAGLAASLQGFGPVTFTIPGWSATSLSVCDDTGAPYWQANFTGNWNVNRAVSVGPNGRPVLAGKFFHTIGFTSLPSLSTSDSSSFVASYNPDGIERWSKRAEGIDLTDVGVTSLNDFFVLGDITDPVVTIDSFHLAVSGAQGAVVRLDSNGNYLCNFNFSNFRVASSFLGPGDEYIICGRKRIPYSSYPYLQPVFAGDTMFSASDACLFFVSVGADCELKHIDSLTNFILPEERVNDRSPQSKVSVYPNPVDNNLCVHVEAVSISSATLNIRDARGKVVRTMETKSKDVEVDVSMLSPGLYVVECVSGTERVVEKFIKQ